MDIAQHAHAYGILSSKIPSFLLLGAGCSLNTGEPLLVERVSEERVIRKVQ